jgi:hypothetical protein
MRIEKVLQLALLGAVGLSLYPAAYADNCSGRWSNVTVSSETIEVAKGHNVTYFHARGSTTSDNSAFNAVGACGGYALSMPDGKVRVVGVCARKTKDGDSQSDEWSMEPGAQRGVWRQSGGTGVFAGKTNSGWWQVLADDGKTSTGTWGGNCN